MTSNRVMAAPKRARVAEADRLPLALAGPSLGAQRARAAFAAAATAQTCVLILADGGLETDSIVQALHQRGRPSMPLIAVDCSAPDPIALERLLFGNRPRRDAPADVEILGTSAALLRARAGTLHLKNVVELPAAAQRRLARILRDGEARSGGRGRIRLRARIVADASSLFAGEVRDGRLRPDLYRRLAQGCIQVPPLRERPADFPVFIDRLSSELGGAARPTFTRAAITVLCALPWHQNLDELRVALERVIRGAPGGQVRQEDVLAHLPMEGAFAARVVPDVSLREARRQFEREYIASVLDRHRWRMSEAARALGIERANLYRKTRQLGIVRDAAAPFVS